jgi:hypothetical protein
MYCVSVIIILKFRYDLKHFQIRIVNDSKENTGTPPSAVITIWNPSEDISSLIKEGKLYTFHNLSANDIR